MLKHVYKNFETYPTHRVVAMIDSKMEAEATVSELIDAGFDSNTIDESMGTEGMLFLDPDGTEHGLINKLIRKWQVLAQGEENKYINRVRDNLQHGHAVVSVPALSQSLRSRAAGIMHRHHASDVRYYGHLYVENLT